GGPEPGPTRPRQRLCSPLLGSPPQARLRTTALARAIAAGRATPHESAGAFPAAPVATGPAYSPTRAARALGLPGPCAAQAPSVLPPRATPAVVPAPAASPPPPPGHRRAPARPSLPLAGSLYSI